MPLESVIMEVSILNTIKKMLDVDPSYTAFDNDILVHINSALMILTQMGVGSQSDFSITGATEEWSDFLEDKTNFDAVKTYIYLKVKLVFDPPTSSSVLQAYEKVISELEWRLNVNGDKEEEHG